MRKANWSRWFAIASYARSSLWIIPFYAVVLDMVVSRFVQRLDRWGDWTLLGLALPGAQALYQNIITLTMSFTVFTFGSLLVAIQVAGGQLTPRVIATTLLRDNTVRYTVGLFLFTMLFTLRALDRMESNVQQISVFVAAALGLASIVAFLYLIDYAARLLRPVSIVWRVGQSGISVLEAVHPRELDKAAGDVPAQPPQGAFDVVLHEGTSGTVLAIHQATLVAEAKSSGGIVELVPHVGDFLSEDEPLFRLYGAARAIPRERLRAAVAIGSERTLEQDPTFAFRILIDIALKALSKAINDPTTAVLAIDQIHVLLRAAGRRHLQHDQITDSAGRALVIIRTPNWEDYVHLACREIRLAAGESIQVARRMRAMIENLISTLPVVRHDALLQELDLLDRMVRDAFRDPEDLALARVADAQGMGGVTTEREAPMKVVDAA